MMLLRLTCAVSFLGLAASISYPDFDFCLAKETWGLYRRTNDVSKVPLTRETGRTIGECLSHCQRDERCFSTIHNAAKSMCSSYADKIKDLQLSLTSNPSMTSLAYNRPTPQNDSAVESCDDRCGEETCKLDCAYDPPQPLCIKNVRECQDRQYNNMDWHYFGPIEYSSTTGAAKTVTFTKKHDASSLRIQWRGDLRTPASYNTCIRYVILIDGEDCADPAPIDSLHVRSGSPANNVHRSIGIEGLCHGISAGEISISLSLTSCPGITVGAGYVGHYSSSWFFIYEVDASPQTVRFDSKPCSGLHSYGVQQYTTYDYIAQDPTTEYQYGPDMIYYKREHTTALIVTFNAAFYITSPSSDNRCATWDLRYNGVMCANPQSELNDQTLSAYAEMGPVKHYGLWKTICPDLPAGLTVITMFVRRCDHHSSTYTAYTGFEGNNSASRFIVEEVKLSSPFTAAVIHGDQRFTRLPQFNMQHFTWKDTNSGTDNGVLMSMTYSKIFMTSGIRAEFNGQTRIIKGTYNCCRYFFTFNNNECTSPGKLDGILENSITANYKRFSTVDGVCDNIASGDISVQLRVGKCTHQSGVPDCYTGYYSITNFYISEINA